MNAAEDRAQALAVARKAAEAGAAIAMRKEKPNSPIPWLIAMSKYPDWMGHCRQYGASVPTPEKAEAELNK